MVSMAQLLIGTLLLSLGTTAWSANQNDLVLDYLEMDLSKYQSLTRLRHLSEEFLDFYQNITLQDILPGESPRAPTDEDLQCLADLSLLTQGVSTASLWAIRMFDSWGSIPSGLLKGNLWDLGNYDECLAIDHSVTSSHSVKGKYCFAKIIPGSILPEAPIIINVNTAVCFPASCSGIHMDTMIRQLFKQLLNLELSADSVVVNDASCKTTEREPFDGITIFTIVLLSLLGCFMVLATLYDYFLCEDQKKLPVLVKAFSARANSRSLFRIVDSKSNPNVIDCLHGIRCISLFWVIFGHDYIITIHLPNINMVDAYKWYADPFSMVIGAGGFSVDTFFFLSGLLVTVVALRFMKKSEGKLNVPMMYLHRYLRLTPVLAISILIYTKILPLLGDGPLYGSVTMDDYSLCKDNWFWTLLYVQNYATTNMCVSHSWYLAADMQMYIIAPFLIIVLYKWGKKGVAAIVVLMLLLASCLFSMIVIKQYTMLFGDEESMKRIYFSTHIRASPFLIGIIFGYFLHVNFGRTFKLKRSVVWLGWIISLSLFFACIFSIYKPDLYRPPLEEAFYLTLGRMAWPLGLCWTIFACMQGYGGLANSFLSSPLWQPLSKLSYCAYIFHMVIETVNGGVTKTSTYFSDYQVMLRFWGDFGFVVILAYFMYVLIEAPFGNLESLLLPTRKPTPAVKVESKVPAAAKSTSEYAPPLPHKLILTDNQPSVITSS